MRARSLWLLSLMLLVSACSGASERFVGWYVTRQIDGYFDLTSEQKNEVRADVDSTIVQIRRDELSRWISLLREVRGGFHDGFTDESLARLMRRYDESLDRGVNMLTPHVAPMLAKLDAHQLDHFTKKVRDDLNKQYEDLKDPSPKHREKLEDKGIDVVEDFVGDLSDSQEASVRALIRTLPNERDAQFRSANGNLDHFRSFMSGHPNAQTIESELHAMWEHRYDRLGAGHDKEARRVVQRRWLLSVYRVLNGEQRAHAEEELSDRIRTLKRWVLPSEPRS